MMLQKMSGDINAARGGALLTLVSAQLIHAFECRSESKTLFEPKGTLNIPLVLSVLFSAAVIFAVVCLPRAAALFEISVLNPVSVAGAVLVGMAVPMIASATAALRNAAKKISRQAVFYKKTER